MIALVSFAVALTIAGLFVLTRPLFRADAAARAAPRQELANLRDRLLAQIHEFEGQRASQSMDAVVAETEQARLEFELAQVLKRLDSTASAKTDESTDGGPMRPRWKITAVLALALPLLAGGLYWSQQGNLLTMLSSNSAAPGNFSPDIMDMVSRLEKRLQSQSDDAQGWAMLGRSYAALGRIDDAKEAYNRAWTLAPDDIGILSGYAWVLYNQSPQQPTPDAIAAYRKILTLDPNNMDAMWVLGLAAFQEGDYPKALKTWETLYASLPPDSTAREGVSAAIEEVRSRLATEPKPNAGGK